MELSFAECLREFRMRGHLPAQLTRAPVLVNYGVKPTSGGQDRGFRTAFGSLEQSQASVADGSAPGEQEMGTVFLIVKKEGAPFPEQIGIGRAANTDVCLSLHSISKYHAFFSANGSGGYVVADAGSKNGSWLDGRRLAPRQSAALVDGSRLRFGSHKFVFYTHAGFVRLLEGCDRW
jgi:hypothetical protein